MNLASIVNLGILLALAYLGVGLLLALWLITGRLKRVDPVAAGGGWGFRMLILPGLTALWPVFLMRMLKGLKQPPLEQNAHRRAAGGAS